MLKKYKTALIGFIIMLIISAFTPIIFNATNLQVYVLFPIVIIFVYLTKISLKDLGLAWGAKKEYGIAILYPVSICFSILILAYLTGNMGTISLKYGIGIIATLFFNTLILAFTTEELFFRGWLYGILKIKKINPQIIILFTAIAFSLWHFPLFFIEPGLMNNWGILPIYLIGGVIAGLIFGLLRYRSGSIVVTSFSHTIWNTLSYSLFGTGSSIGILGIQMTNVFDPERGILGLILSIIFIAILWYYTFMNEKSVKSEEITPT